MNNYNLKLASYFRFYFLSSLWRANFTEKLAGFPLLFKIIFLIVFAIAIFSANFLLKIIPLHIYFFCFAGLLFFPSLLGYIVLERKTWHSMVKIWSIGTVIYLIIAVPRVYWGGMLTPYFVFTSIGDRWLYSLLLPLLMFGTLSIGLVFVRIISPVEFLRFGKVGLKIALLLRVLQQAEETIYETKIALMMQNKWPQETDRIINFKEAWAKIKRAPLLIATTLRNIILRWCPWGWICFNELQKKLENKLAQKSKLTSENKLESNR